MQAMPNIIWLAMPVVETGDSLIAAWRQALDDEERAQADKFRRREDRILYIAAHALLRTALGSLTHRSPESLVMARLPFGKPFLPDNIELHFSLTHTAGLAAVALHTAPIGCDAEPAARIIDDGVLTMMAAEETAWLQGVHPEGARRKAFIKLWVVKEAYCKALGLGLSLNPADYAFDVSGNGIRLLRAPHEYDPSATWSFATHLVNTTHMVAIAAQTGQMLPSPSHMSGDAVARAATGGLALDLPKASP